MEEKQWCGPFWFPRAWKEELSKDFNGACKNHDLGYIHQEITRLEVDLNFYNDMVAQSPDLKHKALLYFRLVRWYAWTSWYIMTVRNWFR